MAPSVGEYLREIRTARGLTLEQASQTTHIRKSFLEAIENGQYDALPSEVQGRGFLRLYASFLDLSAEPLVRAWISREPIIITDPVGVGSQEGLEKTTPAEDLNSQETPSEIQPITAIMADEEDQPDTGPVPVEFETYISPHPEISGSLSIFKEIGELLRQQRETLGLSRAEVERYTRLRQHYLLALEEGRLDLLPSPVQGKGMLSIYASFLNMNEDKLLLRFAEGLQLRRIERLPPTEPQTNQPKKKTVRQVSALQRLLTPDLIFGLVIAVGILFFAVRTALSISSIQNRDSQPTARAIAEILLTPDETNSATPSSDSIFTLTVGVENDTGPVSGENLNPVIENNITVTPTIQPTLAPINRDPLQIYIVANQRAYLRVLVDNQEKFNGRVVPGNAYAFSGLKRIELFTGNAEAIQVFFNQNDIGTIGTSGQVTGLVFIAEGMVTATPFQSPTPTSGGRPTETPRPSSTLAATFTVTPLIP